mgnify:CR=1 FL=1
MAKKIKSEEITVFDKDKAIEVLNQFSNMEKDESKLGEEVYNFLMHSYDQVKYAASIPREIFETLFGDGTNPNGILFNLKGLYDFVNGNEVKFVPTIELDPIEPIE